MTTSRSTPRVRRLALIYLVFAGMVALNAPPWPPAALWLAHTAGFIAVVLAVLARLWTTVYVAGRKDAELVTEGPYAWCRHPLYAASLLAAGGIALAGGSAVLGGGLVLVVATLHLRAVRAEDAFLAVEFRAAHARWADRVPALWPRRPPDVAPLPRSRPVDLFLLRKGFRDAGSFLLLYGLVLGLPALRDALGLAAAWSMR